MFMSASTDIINRIQMSLKLIISSLQSNLFNNMSIDRIPFKSDLKKQKIEKKQLEKQDKAQKKDKSEDDSADQKIFDNIDAKEPIFELGSKKKRVSVGVFMNRVNINLREYFQKDGDWLPTKKGITLSIQQWELLKSLIPRIDSAIEKTSKK